MILKTETHNAVMLAMLLLQINQNRLSEKNKGYNSYNKKCFLYFSPKQIKWAKLV